jgi:hypothetical protein
MHKAFIKKLGVIIFLIIFAFQISANAQNNTVLISGSVVDNEGNPLPFATVYLNNTSFFSITDTLGNYKLWVPTYLQKLELVASFVGFNPGKVTLSQNGKSKKVLFRLDSRTDLAEVTVTAKMDRFWKKKWRIFEDGLLGDTPFANQCEILNPGVIKLHFDKTQSKVTAYSRAPLLIYNKALAYKLQVDVDFFESDGKLTYLATNKYFDSLAVNSVKDLKKIYKNRRRAYDNSFRNFLVSLVTGTSAENGFVVFQMNEIRDVYLGKVRLDDGSPNGFFHKAILRDLIQKDSLINEYQLVTDLPLLIFNKKITNRNSPFSDYPYAFSQVEVPNHYFTFNKNGWILKPNSMLLRNYWAQEGLSNLLPDDFEIIEKPDLLLKTEVDKIEPVNRSAIKATLPDKIILE